jgi:hypothetical protein
MGLRSAETGELCIELWDPDELFERRSSDVAEGAPTRDPGIDRIRRELGSRPLRGGARLAIELPRDQMTPRTEHGIREALVSYCELGIRRAEDELRAIHREGRQALVVGAILLAGFLALAEVTLQSGLPKGIRDFFGNGLFLVAAWVGMWYPLDTLIYAGRPHRIERKVLRAIQDLEIAVRPADSARIRQPGPERLG